LKGVALSHGHYDHTDGLSALLNKIGFDGPIYAHSDFAVDRFKIQKGSVPKPIGLNKDALPWPLPKFIAVSGSLELASKLVMISEIPRRHGLYQSVDGFYFDDLKRWPDRVEDDACLVLLSSAGPGC
jgi:7,8-dihydropterin-6-yl-methyl-4-(beta-D-ribofuranosyl)aminobenzene 5'-phosphate synthase